MGKINQSFLAIATLLFLGAVILSSCAKTDSISISNLFSDNAVLQRDENVRIWGKAPKNQKFWLKFDDAKQEIVSDENGNWQAIIAPNPAGENHKIQIGKGFLTIATLKNISFGDVYLCSGQSNMEFALQNATNAAWEINQSASANISFLNVPQISSMIPQDKIGFEAKWQIASPKNAGAMSAVCYFSAKNIAQSQKVKVGIINASWSGSQIEAWLNPQNLSKVPNLEKYIAIGEKYKSNQIEAKAQLDKLNNEIWRADDFGVLENWQSNPQIFEAEPKISVHKIWENSNINELRNLDGSLWLMTRFDAPNNPNNDKLNLYLGKIDDADEVFVNGQFIGATNNFAIDRNYSIDAKILKPTGNYLIVKIRDLGGFGGFWGAQNPLSISSKSQTINLAHDWHYKIGLDIEKKKIRIIIPWNGAFGLSTLYNGMLKPIEKYNFKGVFWYQGEANINDAAAYEIALPLFIEQLRKANAKPDLPFFMAGLANFARFQSENDSSNWAQLRDVQFRTANVLKNVYLAPTIDIGDPYDIHPTQKRIIGERFALLARSAIYNSGESLPPKIEKISKRQNEIIIQFSENSPAFHTVSSNQIIGFETCNKSICNYANAHLLGNQIIIDAKTIGVNRIRYAWADAPILNLFDSNNMPLQSFSMPLQ
jgi:sialate O-acetylesterase